MKRMKSNLLVLIAQKAQKENRRITLRSVARDLGISKHTVYALSRNQLVEYPKDVLERLCTYFDCKLDDLFTLEEEEG